jgi:hypothetical protein
MPQQNLTFSFLKTKKKINKKRNKTSIRRWLA